MRDSVDNSNNNLEETNASVYRNKKQTSYWYRKINR